MSGNFRKKDIKPFLITLCFTGVIWGLITAFLFKKEMYWLTAIPVALYLFTIVRQIHYHTKTHPHVKDAADQAGKGFNWYLGGSIFFSATAATTLQYYEMPDQYLPIVIYTLPTAVFIWLVFRTRKFISRAKRKLSDEQIVSTKDDQPTP